MKLKMRPLRFLLEHSTVLEDGGVQYDVPVHFFEHAARCIDWREVIGKINDKGGIDIGEIYVANVLGRGLVDHYVFGKNVVVESLDPEFCVSHKLWRSWLEIKFEEWGHNFPIVKLCGEHDSILQFFPREPVSILRTFAARVLTGDSEVLVEGEPHLILGRYIILQEVVPSGDLSVFHDYGTTRNSSKGRIAEQKYRQKEREMR